MKTKKSYRFFSAILAILMVLAVCPMFAISAAEATGQDLDSITYWDGTVPYYDPENPDATFADFEMTVPAFVMSGSTYKIDKATFDAHLTKGDGTINGRYLNIKDEIGLVMLSLITNCPTVIYDESNTEVGTFYDSSTSDDPTRTAVWWLEYHEINIARDLYLNAPGAHVNQIAPLFWKRAGDVENHAWYGFSIKGLNHSINGWYMDVTINNDNYVSNGFVGSLPNAHFTVSNLALVDMELNVTTAEDFTKTAVIGGIVGGGKFASVSDSVTIQGCYVDLTTKFVSHAPDIWNNPPGDLWGSATGSDTGMCYKVEFGGLVGQMYYQPGNVGNAQSSNIQNVSLSNNVILLDYNTNTNCCRAAGITGGFLNTATVTIDNVIVAKYLNSGTITPKKSSGTIHTWGPTDATVSSITDVWSCGTIHGTFTDASNQTVALLDMVDSDYWAANGTGMSDGLSKSTGLIPVPTGLSENLNVMDPLYEYCVSLHKGRFTTDLNAGNVTIVKSVGELVYYATLANQLSKTANIKLGANIDMAGKTMPVIKTMKTFDGQGYVISNYTNTVICTTTTGGFCEALTGSIQNVAFVNYNVSFTTATPATAYEYYVGGLYGSGNNPTIRNVYMQGSLAITGTTMGNTRIGYFAAAHHEYFGDIGASIENSIFVGEVKGATANYFGGDFGEAAVGEWNAILEAADENGNQTIKRPQRQVKITNCYAIPYTTNSGGNATLTNHVGNNVGLHSVALRNCYQTGAPKGLHLNHAGKVGYTNVVDAEGNSLAYLDQFNVGDVANDRSIETAWKGPGSNYTVEQFHGKETTNALQFSNPEEWTWFADGTPIPAVFGDNASTLTVKSIKGLKKTHNSTSLLGAQIRLDRCGVRFIAEFDTSVTSNTFTVEYGVLVLPSAAAAEGRKLAYTDPVALRIATTDTSKLHAYGSIQATVNAPTMLEGYKAIFSVLKNFPDEILNSNQQFQVIPYIAFLSNEDIAHNDAITDPSKPRRFSHIIYGDNPQEFSGLYLANAACASEDLWLDDYKIAVCERFKNVDGFLYEVVDGVVLPKQQG